MVNITLIGHACFLIENDKYMIITDPWITPGTFDKSWYQYPRNEHMDPFIRKKIENNHEKQVFIYISHEHLDHFDPDFLNSLENRNFNIICPKFKRTFLDDWFKQYQCNKRYILLDQEEIIIDDFFKFTLFVEDCELNRDSGILIKIDNYVIYDGNDCKYHNLDLLTKYGNVDILCQQFSGASWHPVCYEYTEKEYNEITKKKRESKKKSILRFINKLNVRMYIPSAGPPVFLDPLLIEKTKKYFTIFSRANWIKDILKEEVPHVNCPIFMPGDIFNIDTFEFIELNKHRVDDYNFEDFLEYVNNYQNDYIHVFEERALENNKINDEEVLIKLKDAIQEKLNMIKHLQFDEIYPTYIKLFNYDKFIQINFNEKEIKIIDKIQETYKVYMLETYGWQINKVLNGIITWDDFHLTLRSKLYRKPDKFQTLLNAFIFQQKEDLERCFEYVINILSSDEKIKIKTPNGEYYEMCKKCPHQGQNLEIAEIEDSHIIVCPKHCWKFDLHNEGKCLSTDDSLQVKKIEFNKNDNYISLKSVKKYIYFSIIEYTTIINDPESSIIRLLLESKDEIIIPDNVHYINLKIENVVRSYTFTNDIINNKTNVFELYIKLYKDGQMSNLLKKMKKNDNIKGKIGSCTVDENLITKNNYVNIIAGGTGITPFIRLIKNNVKIQFNIVYFNKPNSTPLLSNFLNDTKNIKIYYQNEKLDYKELSNYLMKPYINLICGPEKMTEYYKNLLIKNGINLDKVFCFD